MLFEKTTCPILNGGWIRRGKVEVVVVVVVVVVEVVKLWR